MRKTARPVVWEGGGAQSPSLDPIVDARPTRLLDAEGFYWLDSGGAAGGDVAGQQRGAG